MRCGAWTARSSTSCAAGAPKEEGVNSARRREARGKILLCTGWCYVQGWVVTVVGESHRGDGRSAVWPPGKNGAATSPPRGRGEPCLWVYRRRRAMMRRSGYAIRTRNLQDWNLTPTVAPIGRRCLDGAAAVRLEHDLGHAACVAASNHRREHAARRRDAATVRSSRHRGPRRGRRALHSVEAVVGARRELAAARASRPRATRRRRRGDQA